MIPPSSVHSASETHIRMMFISFHDYYIAWLDSLQHAGLP
jgi:hypothetical protein